MNKTSNEEYLPFYLTLLIYNLAIISHKIV
uniref:Transposase n=1 Tax=Heterorhabditis bacteriophora TaxID=37862 RepID=A0A1I7WQJ2_HETBA